VQGSVKKNRVKKNILKGNTCVINQRQLPDNFTRVKTSMFGAFWIRVRTNMALPEPLAMKLTTRKIVEILKNRKHKFEKFIFKCVGKTRDGILGHQFNRRL
jgi:hypothetical protein